MTEKMRNISPYTLLFLLFLLFFGMRVPGLGYDMSNSDAARWYKRSENFFEAIKYNNWALTYQHYQPGVTLMWINVFTKELLILTKDQINVSMDSSQKTLENTSWFHVEDRFSKIVLVMVLAVLLGIQIFSISKLFSKDVAFVYGFLVSLEPYMIGIDRWFHLTSLETYLGFCSLLLILLAFSPTSVFAVDTFYLLFSSLLLALAVLTKLTAFVILPFIVTIIFIKFTYNENEDRSKNKSWSAILSHIFLYLASFTFFLLLFFPALWVSPKEVTNKLFLAVSNAITDDARALELTTLTSTFFYPLVLGYKLSPVTFLIAIFVILNIKTLLNIPSLKWLVLYFVYYTFALSLAQKKIDRYSLVLIMPLLLLISLYINTLTQKTFYLFFLGTLAFTIFLIYNYYPIYSAYYSPLFGSTKTALSIGIYDNSGEYFAQVAYYLNSKGRDIYTYVPDNVDSFSYFYKGRLQRSFDTSTNFVVRSIDIDRKELSDQNCPLLEQSFGPREFRSVVGVFKCQI